MWLLWRHDPGQIHLKGGGPALALQVPHLRRLRPAAARQVLCEEQRGFLSRRLLPEVWDQVFGLWRGHSTQLRGEAGPGQRLPRGLLHVRPLQQEAGHRGRVLLDGGQEAALQTRL